jgi:hypothetical protein
MHAGVCWLSLLVNSWSFVIIIDVEERCRVPNGLIAGSGSHFVIHFANALIAILELNRCGLQWSTMLWLRWNCHLAHARSPCATNWLPR